MATELTESDWNTPTRIVSGSTITIDGPPVNITVGGHPFATAKTSVDVRVEQKDGGIIVTARTRVEKTQ
jgi:hypothetical protein